MSIDDDPALTPEQRAARLKVMQRIRGGDEKPFEILETNAEAVKFFYSTACFNQAGVFDWCQIEAKARMMRLDVTPQHIDGLDLIQSGIIKGRA